MPPEPGPGTLPVARQALGPSSVELTPDIESTHYDAQGRMARMGNYYRWILSNFGTAIGQRVWDAGAGIGNVSELVLDEWGSYSRAPRDHRPACSTPGCTEIPITDSSGRFIRVKTMRRVMRGGNFSFSGRDGHASKRHSVSNFHRGPGVGFRGKRR